MWLLDVLSGYFAVVALNGNIVAMKLLGCSGWLLMSFYVVARVL